MVSVLDVHINVLFIGWFIQKGFVVCSDKIIADIDSGKRVPIKKGVLYGLGFLFSSGLIGWLFTVIFWISGTDNNIAKNTGNLKTLIEWQGEHSNNHDELIYNLTRLLEANGIEWRTLKK